MEKEEILKKASSKKVVVGEIERVKTHKSNWIANIAAVSVAVILMIVLGALGNFTGLYAIAMVCYAWASVFYFCQFSIAKMPWQVLIGGVLHLLAFITMLVFFILYSVGVL